jgi:hypothetical protein
LNKDINNTENCAKYQEKQEMDRTVKYLDVDDHNTIQIIMCFPNTTLLKLFKMQLERKTKPSLDKIRSILTNICSICVPINHYKQEKQVSNKEMMITRTCRTKQEKLVITQNRKNWLLHKTGNTGYYTKREKLVITQNRKNWLLHKTGKTGYYTKQEKLVITQNRNSYLISIMLLCMENSLIYSYQYSFLPKDNDDQT